MNITYYLITLTIVSLIINYLHLNAKKSAMEIVNEMGIGYNLGNLFNCFNSSLGQIKNPDYQITLCGNAIPTKKMISSIKKYGFKTIRFPVTWMHFMDDSGKVNSLWMSRVKEVVSWIIEYNMYCILNIYNDGDSPNWLSKGLISKEKYINLWKQIAEEFKIYDEYLIFESMNEYEYNDKNILFYFNQAFIDTIRNSGGNNPYRLLIISGVKQDIDFTCSSEFKIPKDPSNKTAISINYYYPLQFTIITEDNPWLGIDYFGIKLDIFAISEWGKDADYKEIVGHFELMKKTYIDKGIPVIIGEVGVITEDKKDINSIRDYLNFIFSLSANYKGIMSCLWDTSKKIAGDFNYYNRETNIWYDEKIKNNFWRIYKGKYIKPLEYYSFTNKETVISLNVDGNIRINLNNNKKVLTVNVNVNFNGFQISDIFFGVVCQDKTGDFIVKLFEEKYGKKQYDGNYVFIMDISKENCNNFIEVHKFGTDVITFNNLTVEYEQSYLIFDYKSYKEAISNIL